MEFIIKKKMLIYTLNNFAYLNNQILYIFFLKQETCLLLHNHNYLCFILYMCIILRTCTGKSKHVMEVHCNIDHLFIKLNISEHEG